MPDNGTQAQSPRGGAARALRRPLECTKCNGCNFKSINWEIHSTGKSGGNIYFVAAFGKVTDPIESSGGASIHYKQVTHKMDYTSLLEGLRRGIFTK